MRWAQRLAELTKAEWGIVTAGCAAALTHATLACIAGTNPERMQRIPKLAGLKNEVIIPKHSRNVYDHAVRMPGVDIIEVNSRGGAGNVDQSADGDDHDHVFAAGGQRTADARKTSAQVARTRSVPVIVDAAAEILTIPNKHLGAGRDDGGLQRRQSACAVRSAPGCCWAEDSCRRPGSNSAPHHAFGRSLKVGKEEIMGMLAAVEMWTKRDHDAEWKQWESWLDSITAAGYRGSGRDDRDLASRRISRIMLPSLHIKWDGDGAWHNRQRSGRGTRERAGRASLMADRPALGRITWRAPSPSCRT